MTASPQASVAFRSDQAASATTSENSANLAGLSSAFYRNVSNMNTGTLPSARLAGAYTEALGLTNAANTFAGNGAGLVALNADSLASGTVADARLSANVALLNGAQSFSGAKSFTNAGNSFVGNGAGLTGLWRVGGNAGTNGATDFIGTTDAQPLVLKAGGVRVATYSVPLTSVDPLAPYTSVNTVAGHSFNTVTSGATGGTISGGGHETNGSALPQIVTDDFGTVGGGSSNVAGNNSGTTFDSSYATVAGGRANAAAGAYSTVGGGQFNGAHADASAVAGGRSNNATGSEATVAGGHGNLATATRTFVGGGAGNRADASFATVLGGLTNTASGGASVIGGGLLNTASGGNSVIAGGSDNSAGGNNAAIGGGSGNIASGLGATVPGGTGNRAGGVNSLAAGNRAIVNSLDAGTFVWADNTSADFISTGAHQFLVRATGGVGINTNAPLAPLHVVGGLHIEGAARDFSVLAGNTMNIGHWDGTTFSERARMDPSGNFAIGTTAIAGNPLNVSGTFTASVKNFTIDHPLDPTNKYLAHSTIESDQYTTLYRGTVTLDDTGGASIQLPEWFEALNEDFSYQLTAIGAPMPMLHVAAEVDQGRFEIAGGTPGKRASWMVTGVRKDAYAKAHPLVVEQDKGEFRGTYRHPLEHGAPDSAGEGRLDSRVDPPAKH